MSMLTRWIAALKRVFPRFGLRESDVLLASYPRSGNTWFRFIWANLVAISEFDGMKLNFEVLEKRLGCEYEAHNYGSLEYQCLPRLVKTHADYRHRNFGGNRSIYLVRHPGDVMVSYFEYLGAREDDQISGLRFADFIRTDRYGLPAWCSHVAGWIREAEAVVSYEQLLADPELQTKRILEALGEAKIKATVIAQAVHRSSFESMRRLEHEGWSRIQNFEKGFRFVRSGQRGEWWDYSSEQDRRYLEEMLAKEGIGKTLDELLIA